MSNESTVATPLLIPVVITFLNPLFFGMFFHVSSQIISHSKLFLTKMAQVSKVRMMPLPVFQEPCEKRSNYCPSTKYDVRLCFHTCLSVRRREFPLVSGPFPGRGTPMRPVAREGNPVRPVARGQQDRRGDIPPSPRQDRRVAPPPPHTHTPDRTGYALP